MIDFFHKKTTMTIPEFLKLERGELTLAEIKDSHREENIKKLITYDEKAFNAFCVAVLAASIQLNESIACASMNTTGVDRLGNTLLQILRLWGKWIILIMCIATIIRKCVSGEFNKVFATIVKFVLIFASMYLIPELFDTIAECFAK